jgi:serine/threonine-protein kinase HipA
VKKLEVHLTSGPGEHRLVGQLAEVDRRTYFEYDATFLQDPLWLSPFRLPPKPGLHEHLDLAFGPMFGLFDDSLPDGWGLLLMNRYFIRQGLTPETISPLDRLAYLGERTMGALTYHPPARQEDIDRQVLDLHDMSREACLVLEGKSDRILPQLLRAGGSPGGARPKVLVGLHGDDMISGEDDLPEGYTAWLIKFHAGGEATDDGLVEYAYSQMARVAGIVMPDTRIFHTAEGDTFFGVTRFDRRQNRRVHVHTFGNMIHANFRIPGCDYGLLLKVARILTKNQTDVLALFRMMIFNILAHNRDDHVKNFAFMLDPQGVWQAAPAYDLTFAQGPGGEHTMTVSGEGREPGREHILRIADGAGIIRRDATIIMKEVTAAVSDWPRFASNAGIRKSISRKIDISIKSCLKRINQG